MLSQIVISSVIIFSIFLLIEKYIYDKRIRQLNIRVLVNGTRGKSSVTEFITAALTASGKNTIGKITGILPSLILSNGTKRIIKRCNGARVHEQFKVVRFASAKKAEALVLECMSISPELQQLESRTFKPHIYVLTNILNDHQEELGFSEKVQAEMICSAIPSNSIIVTNEKRFLDLIKLYAYGRNSIVYTCDDKMDSSFESESSFNKENIIIALKVCELLKLDLEKSKNNISKIVADKNPIYTEVISNNTRIRFINAFSANDVESTQKILLDYENKIRQPDNQIFILNSRSDRPHRTMEFVRWLATKDNILRIYLIGSHSLKAKKEMIKCGIVESLVKIITDNEINKIFSDIDELNYGEVTLIGIGNIANGGFLVNNHFFSTNKKESIRL